MCQQHIFTRIEVEQKNESMQQGPIRRALNSKKTYNKEVYYNGY